MKTYGKPFVLLMSLMLALATSCVNDELSEPLVEALKAVPALDKQLSGIESSVKDLAALQEVLDGKDLSKASKALESHISLLKGGVSAEDGTLATLELQKEIASIVGAVEAELLASDEMDESLLRQFLVFEGGVNAWLGETFGYYYPVAVAETKVRTVVAGFDEQIKKQRLYVDAMTSDVEAGLKKDEKPEELKSLAADVKTNSDEAQELVKETAEMAAKVEDSYRKAITAAMTNSSEFDAEAIKTLNTSIKTLSVDNSLAGLISRVSACETKLADVLERLGALETTVGSLEELLGLIQSVSLMTEYSSDNVVAYYNLVTTTFTDEGYMKRQPTSSITMNYVVRPASAVSALTAADLRNSGMKVIGYYAGRIQQQSVAQNLVDFNITNVTADATTGVVTVTIDNALEEDFYYKKTGAKMALSLSTGKTDFTTKFAEVVPKDESGKVYVESLSLSADYIEVDSELTARINATISPENPTDATLIWTTSDSNIAEVSGDGVVTAKVVGEANITVTTKSTNEWGQQLSKVCRVKVMPNIKLEGVASVNLGGTTQLNIKSPNYIDPQWVKWTSSNAYYATVDENGVVTGAASTYDEGDMKYNTVTITCTIGDFNPTVLTHEMAVVYPQPVGVRISSIDDNVSSLTAKMGGTVDLSGTILPEEAQPYFRIQYVAAGGGDESIAKVNFNTGAVTTVGPGAVTVIAQVLNPGYYNYYYPSGSEVWRFVTVNVEPYWVETITLPETLEMNMSQNATLTPVFTSDDPDHAPSYTDLKWTSSNPSIVSVNETTGELTSYEEVGTVTITAETASEWSVADGVAKKATCSVTVKKPVAAIHVGDYYYSDGTWSTDLQSGKTVIGVVFAAANAASTDTHLSNDHPDCSNGLVVALDEYSTAYDTGDNAGYTWSKNDMFNWLVDNGYSVTVTDKIHGYGNTLGYQNLNKANVSSSGYTIDTELVDVLSKGPSTPATSSGWYIPSYKEMVHLKEGLSATNAALAAKGTQVSTSQYITSTVYWDGYYYTLKTFDMSSGGWYTFQTYLYTTNKCRLVLAF